MFEEKYRRKHTEDMEDGEDNGNSRLLVGTAAAEVVRTVSNKIVADIANLKPSKVSTMEEDEVDRITGYIAAMTNEQAYGIPQAVQEALAKYKPKTRGLLSLPRAVAAAMPVGSRLPPPASRQSAGGSNR